MKPNGSRNYYIEDLVKKMGGILIHRTNSAFFFFDGLRKKISPENRPRKPRVVVEV